MAESSFLYVGSDFNQTTIPGSRMRTWKDVKLSSRNFLAVVGSIGRYRSSIHSFIHSIHSFIHSLIHLFQTSKVVVDIVSVLVVVAGSLAWYNIVGRINEVALRRAVVAFNMQLN